ncbi:hypothetical protein QBA54_50790 [Streptomyces sp. B21-108]|uniref:hypothetical protein n=1 Tax=Streptomyces sp. B21-108 TaxID=3039419 RepID=UPI002FF2BEF9
MSFTDSTTGKVIDGKAYVLKTTEGEEIVDPARLFDDSLAARVTAIETALGLPAEPPVPAAGEDQAPVEPEPGA